MDNKGYLIITNNPLVAEKAGHSGRVVYRETSYSELLKDIRDMVYRGHCLLTHPLAGSVKPGETPFRSVMISAGEGKPDVSSVRMIESAIECSGKFEEYTGRYPRDVEKDFQLIDWTLLESALKTAE